MIYTLKEMMSNNFCGGDYYKVTVSLSRWAKVGEFVSGHAINFPRVHQEGRTIDTKYFDNEAEALEYANKWREVINKRIEGKKIDAYNRGKNLRLPFTAKDLQERKGGLSNTDYRFVEVYPFTFGISIGHTTNDDE